jgi:hypothetical protein
MKLETSKARRNIAAAAIIGLSLAVVAVVWFQPHKLVTDQRVDEPLPGALQEGETDNRAGGETMSRSGSRRATKAPRAMILARGNFTPLAHPVRGRASLLEVSGDVYLRLDDFEVENGPDLRVYLSRAPAKAGVEALVRDFVDLGALKGNVGDQNYRVPQTVDASGYRSAVIWCRRFSVGFAVATLS